MLCAFLPPLGTGGNTSLYLYQAVALLHCSTAALQHCCGTNAKDYTYPLSQPIAKIRQTIQTTLLAIARLVDVLLLLLLRCCCSYTTTRHTRLCHRAPGGSILRVYVIVERKTTTYSIINNEDTKIRRVRVGSWEVSYVNVPIVMLVQSIETSEGTCQAQTDTTACEHFFWQLTFQSCSWDETRASSPWHPEYQTWRLALERRSMRATIRCSPCFQAQMSSDCCRSRAVLSVAPHHSASRVYNLTPPSPYGSR